MKIYISADIEGVTGVTVWDETEKGKYDYSEFREQMNREVKATCEGAEKAGAKEIWIKDAHDSGRNIDPRILPKNVKLIRGWSGHPFSMVQELDESFDAVLFIGYHSPSGSDRNPLSHTMTSSKINYIKINDRFASEFLIHGYAAASLGVPVVFVSGDKGICGEVMDVNSNITTVAVKEGIGGSTLNIHPDLAVDMIKTSVEKALKGNIELCKIELPKEFNVEISFKNHIDAYRASFYPGMEKVSDNIVIYNTKNFFDVLRMIMFIL